MFNRKYISRMFYVHNEMPFMLTTGLVCLFHVIAYAMATDAFTEAVMAFGAVIHGLISTCLAYGIYRFEKKYGGAR